MDSIPIATGRIHLRNYILYEFQQERLATEVCRNLLKVFGEGTVSDRKCRRWFEKFQFRCTFLYARNNIVEQDDN